MYPPPITIGSCLLSRLAAPGALLWTLVAGLAGCQPERLSPSRDGSSPTDTSLVPAAGRQNIVVIMTDDQTVESMRVMPQTLGLIGSAGVTFDNSVVTYALCCPSRSTFLTGQYPHNHGVRSNAAPDGGHARLDHGNALPLWLQEAGYVTGHVGKYLNGYGTVDTLEIPTGWTEWYAGIGESAYDYYDYRVNENGTVALYGTGPANYQSDVYTARALDFIHRRARDAAAGLSPFFLWVAYLAPHAGGPVEPGDPAQATTVPAPRHKGRFAGAALPASPAFNEADMSDKPASMRNRALLGPALVRGIGEAYRQRLESLLAVDEGVAGIIDALEDEGVLQNTLIIFTSDNGYFHGEHRVKAGKVLPYEPSVKVPLLIRGPGIPPGRIVTAAVANIDLAPTIVEAAAAVAGRVMDGRSLWPFLSGGQTAWPVGSRHVLVEDSPLGTRSTRFWSIRRGRYVYTEYANGDRELYDLRADSAQLASQHAATNSYARVRRDLAARLASMKTCAGPTACW